MKRVEVFTIGHRHPKMNMAREKFPMDKRQSPNRISSLRIMEMCFAPLASIRRLMMFRIHPDKCLIR